MTFTQSSDNRFSLTGLEYNDFPEKFDTVQKVFEHYFDIAYDKDETNLSQPEEVLYFHFICSGMIDNSGVISLLLETNGKFNSGYKRALSTIGDSSGATMMEELAEMYAKYEKWFSRQVLPPALSDSFWNFDKKQKNKLQRLQSTWDSNHTEREKLFYDYLRKEKGSLVKSID